MFVKLKEHKDFLVLLIALIALIPLMYKLGYYVSKFITCK